MNNKKIVKIENSSCIEVYASTRSIWRGNEWSFVHAKIKLANYFLLDKNIGSRFVLRAFLEKEQHESHITHDSQYFHVHFNKSRGANQTSLLVASDRYNSLDLEISRDLFNGGDVFRVIVAAEDRLDKGELIFGASQSITVTDLSLAIHQRFTENEYCNAVGENLFAWYSKCGGEKSWLVADVELKHSDGNAPVVKEEFKLLAELVYENDLPTPLQPLCPLKDRKTGRPSDKVLFRCSEPIISRGKTLVSIRFRIEEVTFHHSGHDGFRLKISLANSPSVVIHPVTSSGIIVVLSKPKASLGKASDDEVEIPMSVLIKTFRINDYCLCCRKEITKAFLAEESHADSCRFAKEVLPVALSHCVHDVVTGNVDSSLIRYLTVKRKSSCVSLPLSKKVKQEKIVHLSPLPHVFDEKYKRSLLQDPELHTIENDHEYSTDKDTIKSFDVSETDGIGFNVQQNFGEIAASFRK